MTSANALPARFKDCRRELRVVGFVLGGLGGRDVTSVGVLESGAI